MIELPRTGLPATDLLTEMRELRDHDVRWQEGKSWALVYHAGDELTDLLKEAYTIYFSENALNPTAFPSLKKLEAEVVSMTASLLGGDGAAVGNMTSGGTESILMAVKTARDWARASRPAITAPEMVLPETAHPAFHKAAHYFCLKPVHTAIQSDFRADVAATRAAITSNTILMVGSAPSYPQGVVDPIVEMAQIALERDILFHVDACVGGFMLPFVRKLGYPVPDFEFRVPGVTSISVDLHKYIAAAWAIMNHLGEDGYLAIADTVIKATMELREGIGAIDGVKVLGDPTMSILAVGSDDLNVYEVGDELT
jgi:glutamate/tyrosine decarboxylase-like PLP-dependent enzyme